MEKQIITAEGYEKLKQELDYLKITKRNEVAKRLSLAREMGDLSENAEYDAAREEQSDLEYRIEQLEQLIENSEVFTQTHKKGVINIGSRAVLMDIEFKDEFEVLIAGSTEANSLKGIISNESPLGAALIGSKKGDVIKVKVPDGEVEYEVLEVKNEKAA